MLFLQLQRHVFVRVQTREIAKNLDNTTENSCYLGKKSREDKTNSESYNIKKIWLNLNHSTASMAVFFIYMCVCVYCVRCVLCPDGLNFTHKSTVYSNFQQFFFRCTPNEKATTIQATRLKNERSR